MSDVSHAKFISSYHSTGEETDVPDLFYRYTQQYVNIYSQNENNTLISSVTTDDLNNIAGEQQLVIQYVLEATFRKKPILVIVTATAKSTNDLTKSRIYVFWHRILDKETKLVHFNLPMMGDISVIAMTSQPLVLVQKSGKEIPREKHVRHLLAFGKRGQDLKIALLHDTGSPNDRIRGQMTDVTLPSQVPGDITAIHILPQSTRDRRLGHSDPRVFVGTSRGYIQVLRFKALFKKQTLNGIHIEPGYTWKEVMRNGKKPITYLTCKRGRGNNKVIAAVAQKIHYTSLHNDDDSTHDDNDISNDKGNDGASLWVIEWSGNNQRRILDVLAPTKLTSFTLISTRIIPAPKNYQVTAIFQSTINKQHYEINVWTVENGVPELVVSDELFEYKVACTPEDVWPIHLTSKYLRLDHGADPMVNISSIDTTISSEKDENNELSNEHDMQPLPNDININETTDLASSHTHDDDERSTVGTKTLSDSPKIPGVYQDISSSILAVSNENDEMNAASDINGSMHESDVLSQDNHEEHAKQKSVDKNGDLLEQSVGDEYDDTKDSPDSDISNQRVGGDEANDGNDILDFDLSDQQHENQQWQTGDTVIQIGDATVTDGNLASVNGIEESSDNKDSTKRDILSTNGLKTGDTETEDIGHDEHSVTTDDGNNKVRINNEMHSTITDDDDSTTPDHELLVFDDDGNGLVGSDDTSLADESFSREQSDATSLDSKPVFSQQNDTASLADQRTDNDGLKDRRPLESEMPYVKQPPSPSKEPCTRKAFYKSKLKKIAKISLSDGLDMVRTDGTSELDLRERFWILFDVIFSMTRTANSETTGCLDVDKALETLETLSLGTTEQNWLMNYCFTHENPLFKLFIMRYNIKRGDFGLVLMQHQAMKALQDHHTQQSHPGVNSSEQTINDIGRTCNNLAKLCGDMVPSIVQDLPLEIFGKARGEVGGNPFLNEQKPSLLQEKGLGLGAVLLKQVLESRKRRRLV